MITVCSKTGPAKYRGDEVVDLPNPFEGTLVSLVGDRLFVESKHDDNMLYAVATDAILTCDGKIAKAESLTAGRRIRVTTAKCDPNVVIRIEWLHTNRRFAATETTAGK